MKQSFLEQVSQCQTKTPPGFFLPCNLMGISFPHTLDAYCRYAFLAPTTVSQRDIPHHFSCVLPEQFVWILFKQIYKL